MQLLRGLACGLYTGDPKLASFGRDCIQAYSYTVHRCPVKRGLVPFGHYGLMQYLASRVGQFNMLAAEIWYGLIYKSLGRADINAECIGLI